MRLDQKGNAMAEYIWIDANGHVRSKSKVCWQNISHFVISIESPMFSITRSSYVKPMTHGSHVTPYPLSILVTICPFEKPIPILSSQAGYHCASWARTVISESWLQSRGSTKSPPTCIASERHSACATLPPRPYLSHKNTQPRLKEPSIFQVYTVAGSLTLMVMLFLHAHRILPSGIIELFIDCRGPTVLILNAHMSLTKSHLRRPSLRFPQVERSSLKISLYGISTVPLLSKPQVTTQMSTWGPLPSSLTPCVAVPTS